MIESVGWNWNEVTACDISTDGIAYLNKGCHYHISATLKI